MEVHSVWRTKMALNRFLGMTCASGACVMILLAAEPWKSKDYTQWSSEDINKILTDSPWTKEKTVSPERSN